MLHFLSQGSVVTNNLIRSDTPVEIPFLQEHTQADIVILMFGYVGCADVCTPLLMHLQHFYHQKEFLPYRDSVDIVFVNLTPEVQPKQVEAFVNVFEEDFKGVYLNTDEIKKIDRAFHLYYSRSWRDTTQINHSDYVYLLKRIDAKMWRLVTMNLPHPLNQKQLLSDIKTFTVN